MAHSPSREAEHESSDMSERYKDSHSPSPSMTCTNCQEPALTTARFCEACGVPLGSTPAPVASTIQAVLSSGCQCAPGLRQADEEGFCLNCGKRIVKPATSTPATSTARKRERTELAPNPRLAFYSDAGLRHPINEDAATLVELANDSVLLIVADGVSSSWNAKEASATAVRVASETIIQSPSPDLAPATMKQAIERANEALMAMPYLSPSPDIDPPSATIVAAWRMGERLVLGWVGDSRAYLINVQSDPAGERQVTVDDSWAEEVVSKGKMTREQALANRQAHYITQSLGMRDEPLIAHVSETRITADQMLMLCSDGLWNYFPIPGSLAQAIKNCGPNADAITICRKLVALANERGGRDNITIAVLK